MAQEKRTTDETLQTPPPKRRKQTTLPTPDSVQGDGLVPNFDVDKFVKHSNWIGNVKDYAWKPRTSAFFDLVNSQGVVMTVLLFGKISEARVGVYGDFNEIYHRSLLEPGIRNLIWKLGPPNGFSDQFHKQSEALEKIENLLDAHMEPSQRAAKFTAQIELKRKIAKKIDSTTAIIPPDEEKDFWKK